MFVAHYDNVSYKHWPSQWPTLEDFKPEEDEQEAFGGERDGACGGSWSEMSRCLIGGEELDLQVNLAN